MRTNEKHKEAELFYCNYEFEDAPINGFQEPWTEGQVIELMWAFSDYKSTLPTDTEVEQWFTINIGDVNDCSASSAIYKFRQYLNERQKLNN